MEQLQYKSKGGGLGVSKLRYTFWQIFTKKGGRNTFSSFLLKDRGRNNTIFLETWKTGVKLAEHM